MNRFVYNKILLLFVLIGFVASAYISYQRTLVENANKTVDLAIDYEALLELADREGVSREEVLKRAKDVGFTSLAVYETTFKKFKDNGKITAVLGADILKNYESGALSDRDWQRFVEDGNVVGTNVYVMGKDDGVFDETKEDLLLRLGNERVISHTVGDKEVLEVKAHYESLIKMNLGLPTDEMRAVNAAGFYVMPRPSNYLGVTEDTVRAAMKRLDGIEVSEVVFAGKEMLGANKATDATIEEFKARGYTLGLIEGVTQLKFYPQEGLAEISKGVGYDKIARLYSIPRDEMAKIKIATAVERWANTDKERNIRINHLRIFETPAPNMSLLETNFDYFERTAKILKEKGYVFGKAGTYENYYPSKYLRALVVIGVAAGALLVFSLILSRVNRKQRLLLAAFGVLALIFAIPVLMGHGAKVRTLAAFLAANTFPVLGIIALLDLSREFADKKLGVIKLIIVGAFAIVFAGCFSMMGATFLSGALSDVEYFLEFEIFRGIKLTFILPLILVSLAFLSRFSVFDGKEGLWEQLKAFLELTVKVKTLLIAGVVLAAALIFIARSGHTLGMPVPGLELKLRAFLEETFYARPRSKELFIGHPAFMLSVLAWGRKYSTSIFFALAVIATVGMGSMAETFAHMRTPFMMSLWRGVGGLALGGVLGAVLMWCAWFCERLYVAFRE
ncbi:MAG: hypothetical protein IKN43_12950 [Selenomonadaceae bacterium]|nr:hypothetical protein [Selenomonadaceae bacterium]